MAADPNPRRPDHPVDPLFIERWSPRAFTGEDMPVETLMTILEAGRWAPSSYNSQPWRFVWARRGTAHWDTFMGLLTGRNPVWCKDASVLVILVSSKTMMVPGKDEPVASHTHSYDTGAAWMSIALQAHLSGWCSHGMIGFDIERAATELRVPDGFRVEAAFALGRLGDKSKLPEAMQAIEQPNARRPLAESAFEGGFPEG